MTDAECPSLDIFATAVADGAPDLLRPSHKEEGSKSHGVGAETHCLCPNASSINWGFRTLTDGPRFVVYLLFPGGAACVVV